MTAPERPRSYRRLALDPRFGPFLGAALVSNVGNWFHVVTSVIVVYELTGSALVVGLISFSNFAAFLFLTPLAGTTTDRFPRREVLASAQAGSVIVAALLAAAFLTGRGSAVVVLAASLLLGVGSVFSIPATLSIVPELVGDRDHTVAITLNTMAINVARMIGPVAGAFVLAQAGAGVAFAVNSASFAVFALVCLWLPGAPRGSADRGGDRRYRAALSLVWRDPSLRMLFAGVLVVGVLLEPNTTLAAPVADVVGAPSAFVGWIVGAFGAGALLGGVPARRTVILGLPTSSAGFATAAVALVAIATARSAWLVLLGFAGLGAGYLAAISALTTAIQRRAPAAIRGRVMALWSQLLLGIRPVSSLVLGALTDLSSVRVATWLLVALAVLGWWSSKRAHRPIPDPGPSGPS